MNPFTRKLQTEVRKHLDTLLPRLSREWFTNADLQCGSISPVTVLSEEVQLAGSVGVKLTQENLLIKNFHPSLPKVLEGHIDKRASLLESFCEELIYSVTGVAEEQSCLASLNYRANFFQPIVSIELHLNGTVFCYIYLLQDFIEKTWPLKVEHKGMSSKLTPVDETVSSIPLNLYVNAGTLSLSFQELVNLKLGQVVISNLSIRSMLDVKHDGETVFHSYLGRKSNQKTIIAR